MKGPGATNVNRQSRSVPGVSRAWCRGVPVGVETVTTGAIGTPRRRASTSIVSRSPVLAFDPEAVEVPRIETGGDGHFGRDRVCQNTRVVGLGFDRLGQGVDPDEEEVGYPAMTLDPEFTKARLGSGFGAKADGSGEVGTGFKSGHHSGSGYTEPRQTAKRPTAQLDPRFGADRHARGKEAGENRLLAPRVGRGGEDGRYKCEEDERHGPSTKLGD